MGRYRCSINVFASKKSISILPHHPTTSTGPSSSPRGRGSPWLGLESCFLVPDWADSSLTSGPNTILVGHLKEMKDLLLFLGPK